MSYDAHNQASYKLYAILKGVVMQGISNVVRIFFKDQLIRIEVKLKDSLKECIRRFPVISFITWGRKSCLTNLQLKEWKSCEKLTLKSSFWQSGTRRCLLLPGILTWFRSKVLSYRGGGLYIPNIFRSEVLDTTLSVILCLSSSAMKVKLNLDTQLQLGS